MHTLCLRYRIILRTAPRYNHEPNKNKMHFTRKHNVFIRPQVCAAKTLASPLGFIQNYFGIQTEFWFRCGMKFAVDRPFICYFWHEMRLFEWIMDYCLIMLANKHVKGINKSNLQKIYIKGFNSNEKEQKNSNRERMKILYYENFTSNTGLLECVHLMAVNYWTRLLYAKKPNRRRLLAQCPLGLIMEVSGVSGGVARVWFVVDCWVCRLDFIV